MSDFFNKHEDQQGKGLSYDLWKNFPVTEILVFRDLNVGHGVYPDLTSFVHADTDGVASGGAKAFADTDCTITQLTEAQGGNGGGIRLATAATDNVETWLQWCGGVGSPFRISDAAGEDRELIWESAFKTNTVDDNDNPPGLFLGLMEPGSAAADTITDDGDLQNASYIGFLRDEDDGDALTFVYRKNGEAAQVVSGFSKTLAADTWYHVGLRYNAINNTIRAYFGTGDRSTTAMRPDNTNIIDASDISASTFPDSEGLAPIVGIKNATNVAATLDVRLSACGQASASAA